ncbi:MAG: GHKL domain-containing protein [Bacteroidia bacterium]|nr:GHKL domain-containing protein [Bacteroidia bacterium]
MIFKASDRKILLRLALLAVSISVLVWLLVHNRNVFAFGISIVLFIQFIDLFRFYVRIKREVEDFAESTHYRDFSRNYDVKHAPAELEPLRKGFNTINHTLKVISKEKETQYQYLQKILEMVDTAIISYNQDDGVIGWMNDSFKTLLNIPYLKTIHSLERKYEELYASIMQLQAHETKVVLIKKEKVAIKLLLSSTAFQIEGKIFKVVAFQNINEVLEENESLAWQKLLSVMTHEIMNSIAPISSLAGTMKNRMQQAGTESERKEDPDLFEDLQLGIETIKKRSEGLLRFAETYRNLNKISQLNLNPVYVRSIFENLHRLMQPTLEQKNIELDIFQRDSNLQLNVDTALIEQVLINMMVNAMEAVKENPAPKISLSAEESENRKIMIRVADNGTGISAEQLDKIFIPFYTSRKNGTGIGLSLCKQIMLMHKGTIRVQSAEGQGTVFTLLFS